MDIVDKGILLLIVVCDGEHVDIVDRVADDLALGNEVLQEQIALLETLCFLEFQQFGVGHHARIHPFAECARVSLEHLPRLSHVLLVVLVALFADAATLTVVDMIFQTRLVFVQFHALPGDRLAAGTRLKHLFDEFQHVVHGRDMGKRTKVGAVALVDVPCFENTRKVFVGHANAGIGLAVLEQHIVAWIVFLDQCVLKQQCIFFAVDDRIADVFYLAHQYLGLKAVYFFMEIGGDTTFELLCLTYIYNDMILVIELIGARLLGHVEHNVLESCQSLVVFFSCHSRLYLYLLYMSMLSVSRETNTISLRFSSVSVVL